MRVSWLKFGAVVSLVALMFRIPIAFGGKVELKIRVGNPIDKSQKCPIHTVLPFGIGTNDIISIDDLDLGYDVKNDVYFVHKDLDLGPKEIRIFTVELKDIWIIPPADLEDLRKRVATLAGLLRDKPDYGEQADAIRKDVENNLNGIETTQAANLIKPGDRITQHIKTYEVNLGILKRVKEGVGDLENSVLWSGQDPGGDLVGEPKGLPMVRRGAELRPEDYKTVIVRITIKNTSPTAARNTPVHRDLPEEVKLSDILDAGGLETAVEPRTGIAYAYKDEVEIPAGETASYDVKIRDKWNINGPRIATLTVIATNLLAIVGTKGEYKSVANMVDGIVVDLGSVGQEKGPVTFDDRYVAFYREQAGRLDAIERKISRIESALKPKTKSTQLGLNVKPPTPKTTWGIIITIIVFLGVLSLLFFFRWYGRSSSEKMDDAA